MAPSLGDLGINQMSIEERFALAEAIWASAAEELERSALTESQRIELRRRLADSIAHPDDVTPWETVEAEILARGKK
jgi:putative addiction module component (TIGR02574 family)